MRALVCVHPDHDHALPSLRWIWPTERISGGHTSVGAMPRSYQVTPVILDGGGRHRKSRSDHKADRRKVSQPAAVREPNQRAGQNLRPSSRQVLTEAKKGGARDAWAETRFRFGTGITRVRPWHAPSPGGSPSTLLGLPRSDSVAAHGRAQHRVVADRPMGVLSGIADIASRPVDAIAAGRRSATSAALRCSRGRSRPALLLFDPSPLPRTCVGSQACGERARRFGDGRRCPSRRVGEAGW